MPVFCDYDKLGGQFVAQVMDENNVRLSRTRLGTCNTTSSPLKQSLVMTGDTLRRQIVDNERHVHQYLFESRHDPPPGDALAVEGLLLRIAHMTNEGVLPAGPFRTWPLVAHQAPSDAPAPKVSPDRLPEAVAAFARAVYGRWHELAADPVPLAAWSEWQLNGGPLHPFYDGCGRISRSFAAMLFVRGSCYLPLYEDHSSYYRHCDAGLESFVAYVQARIEACSKWQPTVKAAQ